MIIKLLIKTTNQPKYKTEFDNGMDLFFFLEK